MNQTVTEAGHYFEKFKVKAREDVDLVSFFLLPIFQLPNFYKQIINRSWRTEYVSGGKRSFYRRDFISYAQGSWMHVCHLRTF